MAYERATSGTRWRAHLFGSSIWLLPLLGRTLGERSPGANRPVLFWQSANAVGEPTRPTFAVAAMRRAVDETGRPEASGELAAASLLRLRRHRAAILAWR